jgi:hypothetical protein
MFAAWLLSIHMSIRPWTIPARITAGSLCCVRPAVI